LVALLPLVSVAVISQARLDFYGAVAVLAAQATLAVGAALSFRQKSKVALGLDGVYVTGTQKSRFYAYRDLDAPETDKGEIVLRKKGRALVRLQLYGEDAWLRDSILERLSLAIGEAEDKAHEGAGGLVGSVSSREIARLGRGAGDYRAPHVTREQLWDVVAGPSHDARVRTQAARALVRSRREGDQERLVALAERCADPSVRLALTELAEEPDDEESSADDDEDRAVPMVVRAR
jgi:hypothetical protein